MGEFNRDQTEFDRMVEKQEEIAKLKTSNSRLRFALKCVIGRCDDLLSNIEHGTNIDKDNLVELKGQLGIAKGMVDV